MEIWAHTLVKNEERYLWFSVVSVINFVDKVLIWDTGSSDKTPEIALRLKRLFPEKIEYKEIGEISANEFPKIRQQMLDATKADWFIVLDGDEVWWEGSIKSVVEVINQKGNSLESIVVPMVYPIGDIFHKQDESAGKYNLAGHFGNISLRAVNRKIPGLSSLNPHGKWGWIDGTGKMIQDREESKILFINAPYMHFSLVPRGNSRSDDEKVMKRQKKLKYELGQDFPKDYFYPEAFFNNVPEIIPSPWQTIDLSFKIRAYVETPLRKIKRKFFKGGIGY